MSSNQPPSFSPRERRQRPNVSGARRVSKPHSPQDSDAGANEARHHPAQPPQVPRVASRGLTGSSAAGNQTNPTHASAGRPQPPARKSIYQRPNRPVAPRTERSQGAHPAVGSESGTARSLPPSYAPQRRGLPTSGDSATSGRPRRGPAGGRTSSSPGTGGTGGNVPGARLRPSPRSASSAASATVSGPSATYRSNHLRRRRRGRFLLPLALVMVLFLAWPIGLLMWASSKLTHVDALSDAPSTPGTTYLIAGSDKRSPDSPIQDDTEGQRSDTIMLLHHAPNGQSALVSIPRDTWAEIPGVGESKINASYSYGGEPLLVKSVEKLTGLTVDHFVEVGMGGVTSVVDSLGGVELCLDYDVSDPKSELEWKAGCHLADGDTALAFSRMRYSDPEGDIGRARRQREVIQAALKNALAPANLVQPWKQVSLAEAGTSALVTDTDTGAWDLGWMAWYLRAAMKDKLTGTPPIARLDLPTGSGLAVELDPQTSGQFFNKLKNGTLTPEDFKPAQ